MLPEEVVNSWLRIDGCSPESMHTSRRGGDTFTTYEGKDDSEVLFWLVEGIGHTWPGGMQHSSSKSNWQRILRIVYGGHLGVFPEAPHAIAGIYSVGTRGRNATCRPDITGRHGERSVGSTRLAVGICSAKWKMNNFPYPYIDDKPPPFM
jgi:poly(3-hydroxybutyrate) depolymerase